MYKLEQLAHDYHYTKQVIGFLEELNDEKKQANIKFRKDRLDGLENELIKELRTLNAEDIKMAIQDNLLDFLTK